MPFLTSKHDEYSRCLIAEFFGKLIFAFLHSSTAGTISAIGGAPVGVVKNPLLPAISDGLTVAMLIISIGGISGAHINIAVTTAFALSGGMKYMMVPFYFIAEILGSLAGAGLAAVANGEASGGFALAPGVSIGQGLLMEILLTAILTFVVLMVAVKLNSVHAAFAVGFTVVATILAGSKITGACMNPSLGFGAAVVAGKWENHWIYWVGPILGSFTSSFVFRVFFRDKARLLCCPSFSSPPSTPSTPSKNIELEKILPKAFNDDTEIQVQNDQQL